MISIDREQLLREPQKALPGLAREFQLGLPRLEKLHRYARGRHDIFSRQRAQGLPNARLSFGFARYITQVSAAYLLGEPVRYEDAGEEAGVRALSDLYQQAGAQEADYVLAVQQSISGRAVTLCSLDGEGSPKVTALDPRGAFVVRDDTVEHQPLLGVMLQRGPEGKAGRLWVYTQAECLEYPAGSDWRILGPAKRRPHPFGRVPMVEYLNDWSGQGDFEELLPLIDAYDLLGSDRVNDRAQFADALLVLTGVMGLGGEDPSDQRLAQEKLRREKMLSLPDRDAKAEWLLKNPTEQDIDVLRRALAEDIHKFSMTPDFGDERFAGNLSGVAIRYKLFCLEQKTKLKEQCFVKGLRERARVMAGYMQAAGLPGPRVERMQIVLKRKLPESDLERARTLQALDGLVNRETLEQNAPLTRAEE